VSLFLDTPLDLDASLSFFSLLHYQDFITLAPVGPVLVLEKERMGHPTSRVLSSIWRNYRVSFTCFPELPRAEGNQRPVENEEKKKIFLQA
jgi:hypothetical protein